MIDSQIDLSYISLAVFFNLLKFHQLQQNVKVGEIVQDGILQVS